jgi:hypothetical protein
MAVAQNLYILFVCFFFAIAPQGKKLGVLYLDYVLKVKNPPASWGIFVKENKCCFLKVNNSPTSWGGGE